MPVTENGGKMYLTTGKFEGNPKVWQQVGIQETVHPLWPGKKGIKQMTKTLRVRFWLIRVSQGYSKDFPCPLHKTPKPFFHHHFTLTSGRSQFHVLPLFPPQLPSVSHFLRLTTILVTVIITGTKYLIETNNDRKIYLSSKFQRTQTRKYFS